MNSRTRRIVLTLGVIGLLLITVWTIGLASDDLAESFSIPWWTADGGGSSSAGGSYTLRGTVGQPDAGRASGGDYALIGGFWAASAPEQGPSTLYMPFVTR
jgi:hypothetical protein